MFPAGHDDMVDAMTQASSWLLQSSQHTIEIYNAFSGPNECSKQLTLTVRKAGSSQERTVQYDNSTRWVSQEHGSKQVNDIDSGQVKDSGSGKAEPRYAR